MSLIRSAIAAVLVIAAVALTPATLVARYLKHDIANADRYVETVTPLAKNPVVKQAVIKVATARIMDRIPFDQFAQLPILPFGLDQGLSNIVDEFEQQTEKVVHATVSDFVESDTFVQMWVGANRSAHPQVVALLTGGQTDRIDVEDGVVRANLTQVIEQTKQHLLDQGNAWAAFIPEVTVNVVILQSDYLLRAQSVTRALEKSANWLPFVVAALFVVALALSRARRTLVAKAGLGVALSMMLLALGLMWLRSTYVGSLPIGARAVPAAEEVFDTLLDPLQASLWMVFAISLIVALAGWVLRPRSRRDQDDVGLAS